MQYLFILGAGRSGTKFLRDCLGSASDVSAIPYDIGYVWRNGNENCAHDELDASSLSVKQKQAIRRSIDKLFSKAAKDGNYSVAVEKSVPNTLRPQFLKAVYPEAKFLHIVRDGRDVIESSMRNWQSPSDTGYHFNKLKYFPLSNYKYAIWYLKNKLYSSKHTNNGKSSTRLWGPRYKGIQSDVSTLPLAAVCAKQWVNCVEICTRQLDSMDQADYLTISYEDLIDRKEVFQDICSFAQITDVESVFNYYSTNKRKSAPSLYLNNVSKQDQTIIQDIADKTLSKFGYI